MTAKEELLKLIEPPSEGQAERILALFERGEDLEVIASAIGVEYRRATEGFPDDRPNE